MTMEFSTPAATQPAAITASIRTRQGDSPVSGAVVDFPAAFDFNEAFHPARCQFRDERDRTCPPESRVGTISADTLAGPAGGAAYLTEDFRIVIFADGLNGLVPVTAQGVITLNDRGGFSITFSGLPNLPVDRTVMAFDGGDRALLRNPRTCGTYEIVSRLIAHSGESADVKSRLDVTGCPALDAASATVRRRTVTVRWAATAAQAAAVRLQRRAGGRWTTVLTRRATGASLRYTGRPGRYRARVRAVAGTMRSAERIVAFRIP